ncbi:MAG: hypothetical protein QNK30_16780 [Bacteroidales bacterium]|nr:hypothetical protein [Bacteroidales bacterium]
MTEKELINYCCRKIEEIFGHGPSADWSHHHFALLSDSIEKRTKIVISESTLKRLFGKRPTDPDYIPQLATRDVLSKYAGFTDWQDLCFFSTHHFSRDILTKETKRNDPTRKISAKSFVFGVSLILIVVFGFLIQYFIRINVNKVPDFQLSIRNPVDTIPFTAIFDYQVPSKNKDTFYLHIPEFNAYPLFSDSRIYTHWFNFPGLFPVTLHWKNKIIDTLFIHAQNSYWQAGIALYEPENHFKPFYQTSIDVTENNLLYLSPTTLSKYGVDTLSNYWTEFRLFKNYKVSLDDCTISAAAQNNSMSGGKPCYDIGLELVGENGRIQVVFIDKKCFRFVQLTMGEKTYDGKYHDLSMFGTNVKNWTNYQVSVKDKLAMFYIDNEIVFEEEYDPALGQLKGIIIRFFGSGQARSIEITDGKGQIILSDHFN